MAEGSGLCPPAQVQSPHTPVVGSKRHTSKVDGASGWIAWRFALAYGGRFPSPHPLFATKTVQAQNASTAASEVE